MRKGILYVSAVVFLAVIAVVAWWSYEYRLAEPAGGPYTVVEGDSIASITDQSGVTATELAEANRTTVDGLTGLIREGQVITVPPPAQTSFDVWVVHILNLVGEIVGLLLVFWLAVMAGLLPSSIRRPALAIAFALGVASYAGSQWATGAAAVLSPQHIFDAMKDGAAWSAGFAVLARVLGIRQEQELPDAPDVED